PLRSIVSSARPATSPSGVRFNTLTQPSMAASGVRSSCETTERNSSFAQLAASASACARSATRSASPRAASARLRAVMSRVEQRARPSDVLVRRVSEQRELGAICAEDHPVRPDQVEPDGGILEEVGHLPLVALRGLLGAPALDGLRLERARLLLELGDRPPPD